MRKAIAIASRVSIVGLPLPDSSCESVALLSPARRAISAALIPRCWRRRRIFAPTAAAVLLTGCRAGGGGVIGNPRQCVNEPYVHYNVRVDMAHSAFIKLNGLGILSR
ncbi:hypothetical protein GCM10010331_70080 [Streptomyces xanthochromogenes]|nr:hypothetical protein GCM10010331_70080 [Streptomyces xanthochromogenes]